MIYLFSSRYHLSVSSIYLMVALLEIFLKEDSTKFVGLKWKVDIMLQSVHPVTKKRNGKIHRRKYCTLLRFAVSQNTFSWNLSISEAQIYSNEKMYTLKVCKIIVRLPIFVSSLEKKNPGRAKIVHISTLRVYNVFKIHFTIFKVPYDNNKW